MSNTSTPSADMQRLFDAIPHQSHSVECQAVNEGDDGNFYEDIQKCDCGLWLTIELGKALRTLENEHRLMRQAVAAFKQWDDAECEKPPKTTTFSERCGLYALAAEKMEFALSSLTIK